MSATEAKSTGPLQGIRVLDFSAMIAGPYCTRLLADSGAEVIKIEPPEGDYMRGREPVRNGFSAYYGILNCGKQSLCLDLKKPEARELVHDLVKQCDVLVENFRPGVMQRLGFAPEALHERNPRLVYCSISGYGQKGAASQRPAYAPIVHAASGYELANLRYQDNPQQPLKSAMFIADYMTGVHAFGAVNAALVRRARTGQGETIDCALMDSMIGMLAYECAAAQFPVRRPRPIFRPTRALDGFVILAPISPANFADLARAIGRPEWLTDPRFITSEARAENWDALMGELDRWAADRTAAECESIMERGGVPCSRYYTVGEAMALPYAKDRGLLATTRDGAGEVKVPNAPFHMHSAHVGARDFVAALGEHNGSVLRECLGLSREKIDALTARGILRGPQTEAGVAQ
ncbi:MAG TPA: CoA transferase [Burkholderiales bacterium]|nr:CoA transferase [Burkholderiales bacterium]